MVPNKVLAYELFRRGRFTDHRTPPFNQERFAGVCNGLTLQRGVGSWSACRAGPQRGRTSPCTCKSINRFHLKTKHTGQQNPCTSQNIFPYPGLVFEDQAAPSANDALQRILARRFSPSERFVSFQGRDGIRAVEANLQLAESGE